METKQCPNCKNEMPVDANLCPYCGTNMNGNINRNINTTNYKINLGNDSTKRGLLVALLAVIGIIVMFAYRAWLGIPIYLVAFFIAVMQIRNEYEAEGGALDEFIKDCIKNKDLGTKMMTVTVLIAPIVLIVGAVCWIYLDTSRQVDAIYNWIACVNYFKI